MYKDKDVLSMIDYVLKKIKNIIITLRLSILSIFVTLFVIAMLTLIALNYHQSSSALLFVANQIMERVSNRVDNQLTTEIQNAQNDSQLSIQLIQEGLVQPENQKQMVTYTLNLAYQFYLVQAVRWSDIKGNYIKAEYDTDETIMTEIVNRTAVPPTIERIYRDVNLNIIKHQIDKHAYFDARTRPWYKDAISLKKSSWTNIYRFQPSNVLGVSLSTPIYSKAGELRGVLDFDISLDWLSWYLSEQKISPNAVIFLVTKEGKIIAHSKKYDRARSFEIMDINTIDTPWLTKSFNLYIKNKIPTFNFSYKGNDYLATYKQVPHFAMHGWIIGVVVPESDFTGSLQMSSLINTLIGLSILLLGVLLISTLVSRLVRPINNLVKETDKIRHFKLDGKQQVKSNIKEVMALSDAIHAMKMGLRSFKKYIPASLVRQLIEAGEYAHIGGTKKTIVVLFSDIVNFTSFSENMDPNILVTHICDYLDELSKIIVKQKGTIDKYIGDSIMAFWGAPLPVNAPSIKAARAALQCKNRLIELNKLWASQNKPMLPTRFGLHIGDAIVGNLGSSERINYTALGDTVNLASRLEGVNKIYGTSILISEPLYQHIKSHFILRKVDNIAVKGKKISYTIYELLAEKEDELSFDIHQYQQSFDAAFKAYSESRWDDAITLFEQCLQSLPDDSVAPVFIERCRDFKSAPPQNWDGVWRVV